MPPMHFATMHKDRARKCYRRRSHPQHEDSHSMTSLFDLYKVGVGPSSSHTMGPMRGAFQFTQQLEQQALLERTTRVEVHLYGSLALTGIGHATDRAILLGLSGCEPSTIAPESIDSIISAIRSSQSLPLHGTHTITFDESRDLLFHRDQMYPPEAVTHHPNGLRCFAFDASGNTLATGTWFSIGGGFIVPDGAQSATTANSHETIPYPFHSAAELLELSHTHSLSIAEIMLSNECARIPGNLSREEREAKVRAGILHIWQTMQNCVTRGIATEGILPGGLNVRRRAHRLAERLRNREQNPEASNPSISNPDPLAPLDHVTVYAMAVNEENAAGGRVVTAPTNGAAGVVPAVAHYYANFIHGANEDGILRFFLT